MATRNMMLGWLVVFVLGCGTAAVGLGKPDGGDAGFPGQAEAGSTGSQEASMDAGADVWPSWRLGEAWQPCAANLDAGYVCADGLICMTGTVKEGASWAGWFLWCAPPCDPDDAGACKGDRYCARYSHYEEPSDAGDAGDADAAPPVTGVCILKTQPENGAK